MPSPLHPTRTYDRAQGPSQIIVVTLPPQVFTQSLTATLSFSGAFTKGLLYVRSFTATLFGGGGTSSTIDSYSETNRSEDQQVAGGGGANNLAIGQCFTGSGLTLGSCKFYLKKTGSPTGNATAKIFATLANTFGTDACPSGSPPTVAATSDNLDVSTISTTQALVTLTFSGANQITLTNGTHYGISFEFSGGDGSNYILIADDATSPTHSGNGFYKDAGSTPGYGHAGFDTSDVCFYVYSTGGGAGPSVTFARKPLKTLAATFSPVTALAKKIIDSGFVATLSFVGATTKKIIDAGFTATRSFVGNLAASKTFVRAFTATLFQSGGALASDNFNRADGVIGANWGSVSGLFQFEITSNQADTLAAGNFGSRYTAVSALNDQYSKCTVTALNSSTSTGIGPAVRMASGARTMYLLQGNTTETTMFKAVNGVFTQLGSTASGSAVNDILEIDAVGTSITGKKNGVTIIGPVTDSAIASGNFGIWGSDAGGVGLFLDNWEGGTASDGVVATLGRKPLKALTGTFSPVAAFTKRITHGAFTATLSFVGVIARSVGKSLSAALSWVGNLATSFIAGGGHVFTQAYDATLSFVGAFAKLPRKSLSATLSDSAALTRKYLNAGFSATLSFVGAVAKSVARKLAATLSFIGGFATSNSFLKSFTATLSFAGSIATSVHHFFLQSYSATLSFSGALSRRTGKALSATRSFVGNLNRNLRKGLSAALSWIGNLVTQYIPPGVQTYYKDLTATLASSAALTKKNIDAGFSAVLSFVGNLAQTKLFLRLFTATLSSTAALARSTRKAFAATLSTATSLIKRITRTFSATLAFAGLMVKAVRDAGFTATLSFAGNLATATHHFFVRGFTATLSFVGNLSRTRTIVKLLTATLAFTGSLRRAISKSLTATLNFSAALRRTIRKGLAAILSFVGFVFRGLPSIIRAGQVAGATLIIAVASGFIRVLRTASFIKIATKDVAGSTIKIQKAGSQLRVERTE